MTSVIKDAILPARLKPGDRVRFVSPASPVAQGGLDGGAKVLEGLGLVDMFQTFEDLERIKDKQADIKAIRKLLDKSQTDSLNIEVNFPMHGNQSKIDEVRK